LLLYLT